MISECFHLISNDAQATCIWKRPQELLDEPLEAFSEWEATAVQVRELLETVDSEAPVAFEEPRRCLLAAF